MAKRVLFPMKFRLYVDEVGNGDLKGAAQDPNVRFLSLTGILTRQELHDTRIQPEIEALKADLFGHTPAKPVILHRREIMRAEGPFKVLRDAALRAQFNDRLLTLVDNLPYLAITAIIDKKAHLDHYEAWHFDPYHYCLQCVVERYVMYLHGHGWRGDVMIEARSPTLDKKVKSSFRRVYENGTDFISSKITQSTLLSHDISLKLKTANIAGLQLADALAHPSYRHMKMEREGIPQPDDFGTKVANVLVEKKYRRHPATRKIDGFGRKWLPY